MREQKPGDQTRQNRETQVAHEIFSRERGVNPEMPFTEFLARIEGQAREQVREERRQKPRP